MSGSGGLGSGTNKLGNTAPGSVDPFAQGILAGNTGASMQAMHNRYTQLGLGVPGGSAPQAAASGGSLSYAGPGTAEQMDLGALPSLTGGIPGMAAATMGQMQNNALSAPISGGGKSGGGLGSIASIAGMAGGV